MPHRTTGSGTAPSDLLGFSLGRLVEFAEPARDDTCLDISYRAGPLTTAIGARTRCAVAVDAAPQPARRRDLPAASVRADPAALPYRDGTFTLVTIAFSLQRLPDPQRALREMLRVSRPGGRLIVADLIRRTDARVDRDRLERLRDPAHPGTLTLAELTALLAEAGADVRRLDLFMVERPAEPWLAGATDQRAAIQLRQALAAEIDGGPATGAKPRLIGGELWFTQSLAHVAAIASASTAPQVPVVVPGPERAGDTRADLERPRLAGSA